MSHADMSAVQTVDDAAGFWERRLAEEEEARERAASHWTRAHPPNVFVEDLGPEGGPTALRNWMWKHTRSDLDIPSAMDVAEWEAAEGDDEVAEEVAELKPAL